MPFQKGQVKNSHSGLNMGSKSDTEQIQNLQFQLFALNELKTLDWILFSAHDLALSAKTLPLALQIHVGLPRPPAPTVLRRKKYF